MPLLYKNNGFTRLVYRTDIRCVILTHPLENFKCADIEYIKTDIVSENRSVS